MKRKVVKLGPATLVVSLPSKWTRDFNVSAGDEVEIEEKNSDLLIRTAKGFNTEREIIDLSPYDFLLKRIIAAKYLKGSDEIEVKVDSLEKSRLVQKRVDDMIGVEIIEQGKNRLLLKDIGATVNENIDNILRRVLYLLHSISDETLNAIKHKETKLDYLKDMELNINKFTEYCTRLLNKKGYVDSRKTAQYYCIVFLLEQLGDDYKQFISFINENKFIFDKPLMDLYISINSYHKNFEKLFLKYTLEDAIKLAKERDDIINKINLKLKNVKSPKEAILLIYSQNIVGTIIRIMNELMSVN